MEEVEYVAEVVENAASAVEKLSEEMVQKIPDNHDKLKRTALLVERISKATAQDAQLTLNILHKVYLYSCTLVRGIINLFMLVRC